MALELSLCNTSVINCVNESDSGHRSWATRRDQERQEERKTRREWGVGGSLWTVCVCFITEITRAETQRAFINRRETVNDTGERSDPEQTREQHPAGSTSRA